LSVAISTRKPRGLFALPFHVQQQLVEKCAVLTPAKVSEWLEKVHGYKTSRNSISEFYSRWLNADHFREEFLRVLDAAKTLGEIMPERAAELRSEAIAALEEKARTQAALEQTAKGQA